MWNIYNTVHNKPTYLKQEVMNSYSVCDWDPCDERGKFPAVSVVEYDGPMHLALYLARTTASQMIYEKYQNIQWAPNTPSRYNTISAGIVGKILAIRAIYRISDFDANETCFASNSAYTNGVYVLPELVNFVESCEGSMKMAPWM